MAKRGPYQKAARRDLGVALYLPTPGNPRFRVLGSSGRQVPGRVVPMDRPEDPIWAEERAWADEAFDRAVAWARAQQRDGRAPEPAADASRARTVGTLVAQRQRVLAERVEHRQGSQRTLEKAGELHRLYVLPALGKVHLMDWTAKQSGRVVSGAKVGADRRASIGAELRALVTLAHELGWLPQSADPMAGVRYWKSAQVLGQATSYIPDEWRPSTEQAKALAVAMGERCRATQAYLAGRPKVPKAVDRDWGELICEVGAFSGLRPGERWGLTVESVLHSRGAGQLHVIHALEESRKHGRRLKGLKGRLERYTVVPEDIWPRLLTRAEALVERFGEEQGMHALLFPLADHRLERVELTSEEAERRGRRIGAKGWVDLDYWGRSPFQRSLFLPAAAAAGWPDVLEFEHLRHHFATWLFALTNDITLVSTCMGHKTPQVTWNAYFGSSQGALEKAAAGLRT